MTELRIGEFDLDGYVFGGAGPIVVSDFDPGDRSLEVQDTRGHRGGLLMGRDYELAPEWTFEMWTDGHDGPSALAAMRELRKAWQGPIDTPGALSTLRFNLDGQTRRVLGRPRRVADLGIKEAMRQGVGGILATFQLADATVFGDEGHSVTIPIVPASGGGLQAPLVAPLSTSATGASRAGFVVNDGTSPSPVTALIHGPITDPWIRGEGWEVSLGLTLAYDRYVTLDARNMTVLLDGGASVAGTLSRRSRLPDMRLPVGQSEVTFGGTDPTGTAYCEISWHDAQYSL